MTRKPSPEHLRLIEDQERSANWKRWGPYLADRQWGTVREDYSDNGAVWTYFPHDHARSRAYRWGEDGLLGITDRQCRLCFAIALWNEKDPILKERLFGLTPPEANHGEDVKECYYFLDSTPTHSYMRALYKYPQNTYPYDELVRENQHRSRNEPEYELIDTGIFDGGRYFDIFVEYAKASPDDIRIKITAANRGPDAAPLHILPSLWFRNTWSWGRTGEGYTGKPTIKLLDVDTVLALHPTLGAFSLTAETSGLDIGPLPLFTDNETNASRLFGGENPTPYVKDAFHEYLVHGKANSVDPGCSGTKSAFHYNLTIPAHSELSLTLRLSPHFEDSLPSSRIPTEQVLKQRRSECDEYYQSIAPPAASPDSLDIIRQAYAGLLWSKQFYYYAVGEWAVGDPVQGTKHEFPKLRNSEWYHLYNRDVISMPDKWEYPWYAAWDLAFHCVAFAKVDPDFAKNQLLLLLREWYMHPNGQIPAYEFEFSQVNPPVHAWACLRVYQLTADSEGDDVTFLKRCFTKLLLNFTWWINRKDIHGRNLFSGGFLGLDNIGVFDRGAPLPKGGHLEQADATAWMAFYCLNMLSISLELAKHDEAYEDLASKFFEHFVSIVDAMNHFSGTGLWDQQDGFYYDRLQTDGASILLRVRSLVGLIPLLAVDVLNDSLVESLPGFAKRLAWFLKNRPELAQHTSYRSNGLQGGARLLAVPSKERLERMLKYVLDEQEFLSQHGIRSLSKIYQQHPYAINLEDREYRIDYSPGDSNTDFFGGNSNWRGPIWFPINFLLIEALQKLHSFYGDELKIPFPSHSGEKVNLNDVARNLAQRLCALFKSNEDGFRPCHGKAQLYAHDPNWNKLILFYEHFHGDNGSGVGASHQTGWTALVARLLEEYEK